MDFASQIASVLVTSFTTVVTGIGSGIATLFKNIFVNGENLSELGMWIIIMTGLALGIRVLFRFLPRV